MPPWLGFVGVLEGEIRTNFGRTAATGRRVAALRARSWSMELVRAFWFGLLGL